MEEEGPNVGVVIVLQCVLKLRGAIMSVLLPDVPHLCSLIPGASHRQRPSLRPGVPTALRGCRRVAGFDAVGEANMPLVVFLMAMI